MSLAVQNRDMNDDPRNAIALRVTRIEDAEAGIVTLRVEGRLVAEAVAILERECQRALREAPTVRVDFSGVTFIDGRGVDMLKRFRAERLRIANSSVFIQHLLYGAESR